MYNYQGTFCAWPFRAPSTLSAGPNETRSAEGALAVEKKVASRLGRALERRALIGSDALPMALTRLQIDFQLKVHSMTNIVDFLKLVSMRAALDFETSLHLALNHSRSPFLVIHV